jgi:protein SCO1/2
MQVHSVPGRALRRIIPLLFFAALLTACEQPRPPEITHGTLLPSPRPVADFSLVDQAGRPFTLEQLKGHWTFTFFGYTVMRKLEDDPAVKTLPRGLFVSVDPERDTPELLAQFVPYFHPDFIGATGDPEQIRRLTHQLGILYKKAEGSGEKDYLVDHSAAIILFDPEGKFHALFNVPHDPAKIAAEYIAIADYYEAIQ